MVDKEDVPAAARTLGCAEEAGGSGTNDENVSMSHAWVGYLRIREMRI